MHRTCYPIEISTDDGRISLFQDERTGEGSLIYLAPEQIPTIIEWLREAAEAAIAEAAAETAKENRTPAVNSDELQHA